MDPWSLTRRDRLPSHCSRPCPCSFEALRRLQVASRTNTFLSPQKMGIAWDCKKKRGDTTITGDVSGWSILMNHHPFYYGFMNHHHLDEWCRYCFAMKKGAGCQLLHLPIHGFLRCVPVGVAGDEPCRHITADILTIWWVDPMLQLYSVGISPLMYTSQYKLLR